MICKFNSSLVVTKFATMESHIQDGKHYYKMQIAIKCHQQPVSHFYACHSSSSVIEHIAKQACFFPMMVSGVEMARSYDIMP